METKVVVMPPTTKPRIRIRIGIIVYELSVNVAITPVPLQGLAPVIVMPDKPKPDAAISASLTPEPLTVLSVPGGPARRRIPLRGKRAAKRIVDPDNHDHQ